MSGICDTCKREPCHMRFDGCKTCDVYEGGETRYEQLFGTPERAARTSWYMLMCKHVECDECPISEGCDIATDIDCDDGEVALLEWLRGDA